MLKLRTCIDGRLWSRLGVGLQAHRDVLMFGGTGCNVCRGQLPRSAKAQLSLAADCPFSTYYTASPLSAPYQGLIPGQVPSFSILKGPLAHVRSKAPPSHRYTLTRIFRTSFTRQASTSPEHSLTIPCPFVQLYGAMPRHPLLLPPPRPHHSPISTAWRLSKCQLRPRNPPAFHSQWIRTTVQWTRLVETGVPCSAQ